MHNSTDRRGKKSIGRSACVGKSVLYHEISSIAFLLPDKKKSIYLILLFLFGEMIELLSVYSTLFSVSLQFSDAMSTKLKSNSPVSARVSLKQLAPITALSSAGKVESILIFGKLCEVIQTVSDGSKSVVYLCLNSGNIDCLPPRFAVKRMYFDLQHEAQSLAELETMKPLHCPYIVSVEDGEIARIKGKLCVSLVLEYCPDTLHHVLKQHHQDRRSVSEETVWKLLCCMAGALGYLHSMSPPVAHRDVKVENVLIGSDGNFKLCDFGSASTNAYQCLTSADVTAASRDIDLHTTMSYRAPEMADPWQKKRIDEQCDVWALGVLVYYVMFFRFPFEETHLAILNGTLDLTGGQGAYSDSLTKFVSSCLVRDPTERWTIFDIIGFLKSIPHCSNFEFGVERRPSDWYPQPISRCMTSSASPVADCDTGAAATKDDANSSGRSEPPPPTNRLFSMLHWDRNSASQESSTAAAPPQQLQVSQALDDLFSWEKESGGNRGPDYSTIGEQLDRYFAPQASLQPRSNGITADVDANLRKTSPSALDHLFES